MKPTSIRLPDHILRAYDSADGSRSKVMRQVLSEAVADGSVAGVDEDLQTLAAIERVVDDGKLEKRRGTFRKRCAQFFEDKWRSGYVPPADMDSMAESWRREAAIYGEEYAAWVEAVVGWYRDNWEPVDDRRDNWPDAGTFWHRTDPDAIDVETRLVETMREARETGLSRSEAIDRVSKFHAETTVRVAASRAWNDDGKEA